MVDNNKRRRDRNRAKNGGAETRGRPRAGGMIDKYTGLMADDAAEFSAAMDKFKKDTHTRFPSWTETLSVLKSSGYRKEVS